MIKNFKEFNESITAGLEFILVENQKGEEFAEGSGYHVSNVNKDKVLEIFEKYSSIDFDETLVEIWESEIGKKAFDELVRYLRSLNLTKIKFTSDVISGKVEVNGTLIGDYVYFVYLNPNKVTV